MQFYVMTRTHVWQFTLVRIEKCYSTILWIMSSYFPMTDFKATVCASTGDNRNNCANTRWGPIQVLTEVDVPLLQWTCHWGSLGRHKSNVKLVAETVCNSYYSSPLMDTFNDTLRTLTPASLTITSNFLHVSDLYMSIACKYHTFILYNYSYAYITISWLKQCAFNTSKLHSNSNEKILWK